MWSFLLVGTYIWISGFLGSIFRLGFVGERTCSFSVRTCFRFEKIVSASPLTMALPPSWFLKKVKHVGGGVQGLYNSAASHGGNFTFFLGATRKVHGLVDVLAFVMVLFQSGDFEYIFVFSGWAERGSCCAYLQNLLCTPRKHRRAAKDKVARIVWEYQRFPTRLLSSMGKYMYLSLKINMQ